MSSLDITNLFSVKGYVAVITGGTSGIGLMIAKGLITNGAKVYIAALPTDYTDTIITSLNTLGQQTGGGTAQFIPCDITSNPQIQHLYETISAQGSHIDILISNAGIRRDPLIPCDVLTASLAELRSSLLSSKREDWSDTFAVNSTGHYFLAVLFLPLLAKAAERGGGRGVVIVTSSCASMHNATNVDMMSYATSKAATDHLVKLLAAKFSRWYVRVVGINPGFVPSRMNPVGEEGNMFANLFDKVPAKRAGSEEDMAGAVLYLASRAGAYVDGVNLCIDGGRILLANGQE